MTGSKLFHGEIEMDAAIRQALTELKDIAKRSSSSEVPQWLQELVVDNVAELLDEDASNHKVANELVGGLRAIMDGASPSDDDPIVSRMVSVIDAAESVRN